MSTEPSQQQLPRIAEAMRAHASNAGLTTATTETRMEATMEFKRLFTREEAVRTLPLVRRIVGDILSAAGRLRSLPEKHAERERFESEVAENFAELEEIGCFYKDWSFSTGLVDFPAEIDGETVFLCWRSDEPELAFYHRIEDGYSGRRPLPR